MPSPKLTAEQAAKQKEALKKFHADKNKPTSADIPRNSKVTTVRRKLSELTEPSAELIKQLIEGGLVPEREVWKGTDEEKQEILRMDASASFEVMVLPDKREIDMLVRYVPVPTKRAEMAKWVIVQDASLRKAEQEARLRKLELLKKSDEASKSGLLNTEEEKKKAAEEFGGPKLVVPDEWVDDEDLDDE